MGHNGPYYAQDSGRTGKQRVQEQACELIHSLQLLTYEKYMYGIELEHF